VWAGNVAGAAFTYALGRRLGAGYIERKFLGGEGNGAQQRLEKLYNRYGLGALFLSRFLPGVRAIVPPFAGALRVPAVRAMLVIGIASGIWYGAVAWLAFRLGADWERVAGIMARQSRVVGIVVAVLVAVVLAVWMLRRRGRHVRS
jgi:membrane protein DedA with SNARE-associated domain